MNEAVAAFWDLVQNPTGRTATEIHHVLDLWEFEEGTEIALYFVQAARRRWHKDLPDPDRELVIEDVGSVHHHRVERIIAAIVHLARVRGIDLEEPDAPTEEETET